MVSVTFSAYLIRIEKIKTDSFQELYQFNKTNDFLKILDLYLGQIQKSGEYLKKHKKMGVLESKAIKERKIKGSIKYGTFGFSSDIVETETGELTYPKVESEADLFPYYFQAFIPEGRDEGILLTQNIGVTGIYSVFRNAVVRRFNKSFPKYRMHLNQLIPEDIIDRLLSGGPVASLAFVKFGIPKNLEDAIDQPHTEKKFRTELVVSAKGGFGNKIKSLVRKASKKNQKKIVEIIGFEYDFTKAVIDLGGGKTRTINLLDLSRIRPKYELSDEVEFGLDGHPTSKTLDAFADDLMLDLAKSIGIEGDL